MSWSILTTTLDLGKISFIISENEAYHQPLLNFPPHSKNYRWSMSAVSYRQRKSPRSTLRLNTKQPLLPSQPSKIAYTRILKDMKHQLPFPPHIDHSHQSKYNLKIMKKGHINFHLVSENDPTALPVYRIPTLQTCHYPLEEGHYECVASLIKRV